MADSVLIDAGPLIALFDKDDRYHDRTREFLHIGKYRLLSTTAGVSEGSHMLDFNVKVQIDFLTWILQDGVNLHPIQQDDIGRIITLTTQFSDRPRDFADATLVITAEKTGINDHR